MLKVAYEAKKDLPNAEKIKGYLEGKSSKIIAKLGDDSLTEEELDLKTEVINLQKEGESYMASRVMPFPERMKAVLDSQQAMVDKIGEHAKLKRIFYVTISDTYATFEWYDRAIDLLKDYEKSMGGKVLPNGYYTKKLQYQDSVKKQHKELAKYKNNAQEDYVKTKLTRDMRELEIFGSQMQEFVSKANSDDVDFKKICQRLKEYRWGNKTNRHVIVINKYQELLFSSLEGTLPLERYRDTEGKAFLKNITFMGSKMDKKHVQYFPVDLSVNGKSHPYVVMYTYIPKHESYIVVRLSRDDIQ
jgi:hypothetical protein